MQARHVSHANNKSKRKMFPNLRSFKLILDGLSHRVKLCVKCLRDEREKAKKLQLGQKSQMVMQKAEEMMRKSREAQKERTFG